MVLSSIIIENNSWTVNTHKSLTHKKLMQLKMIHISEAVHGDNNSLNNNLTWEPDSTVDKKKLITGCHDRTDRQTDVCHVRTGKDSRSISSRSWSDVLLRNSIFLVGVVGRAWMYHHTHIGPLGQFSGVASMGGRGLHSVCMIMTCGE